MVDFTRLKNLTKNKVIVGGSRDFSDYEKLSSLLSEE